jgi:hypothetical protein
MNRCNLCRSTQITETINGGPQPLANRFIRSVEEREYTHPKRLGYCMSCGLAQLIKPVPAVELKPRYDWITYNEPEDHLDELADELAKLPGISRDSEIGAISFKDDTLLKRFENKGFKSVWRIDPAKHLKAEEPGVGVETVQDRLAPSLKAGLSELQNRADILLARHILEHAIDMHSFVSALNMLLRPGGYVLFEVPCCDAQFENLDYAGIWEEHISYFTPVTFQNCFGHLGFSLLHYERVKYPQEDSLVGVGQMIEIETEEKQSVPLLGDEIRRIEEYGKNFIPYRHKVRSYLSDFKNNIGKIALFGAGHMGCTFVNLLQLQNLVDFFVDDNPDKAGLYMPGSRLPIYPSSALLGREIKLCLLSLNPAIEEKVIQKNRAFLDAGGRFVSIFPGSNNALKV